MDGPGVRVLIASQLGGIVAPAFREAFGPGLVTVAVDEGGVRSAIAAMPPALGTVPATPSLVTASSRWSRSALWPCSANRTGAGLPSRCTMSSTSSPSNANSRSTCCQVRSVRTTS